MPLHPSRDLHNSVLATFTPLFSKRRAQEKKYDSLVPFLYSTGEGPVCREGVRYLVPLSFGKCTGCRTFTFGKSGDTLVKRARKCTFF
jgi:hypothetical protein